MPAIVISKGASAPRAGRNPASAICHVGQAPEARAVPQSTSWRRSPSMRSRLDVGSGSVSGMGLLVKPGPAYMSEDTAGGVEAGLRPGVVSTALPPADSCLLRGGERLPDRATAGPRGTPSPDLVAVAAGSRRCLALLLAPADAGLALAFSAPFAAAALVGVAPSRCCRGAKSALAAWDGLKKGTSLRSCRDHKKGARKLSVSCWRLIL